MRFSAVFAGFLTLVGVNAIQAEFDCNANGVADTAEIASGELKDCNANGIPDTCDTVSGASLTVASRFSADGLPLSLATADMNGDNRSDLVYVNRADNQAVVLLNDGAGGFTAHPFPVGSAPESVVIVDLSDDERADLATANAGDGTLSVLLQVDPSGGAAIAFAPAVSYPVGANPTFVIAMDLNNDAKPDLAAANRFSNNISKLVNTGTGQFTSGGNQAVGVEPIAMTAGDFDGDGQADLAVANLVSDNLSILLTGGEQLPPLAVPLGGPFSIASGDFDGDGETDLAVANYDASTITLLRNNGGGDFISAGELDGVQNPAFILASDTNGDQKLDLVVADATGVLIFAGAGDGTFLITRVGAVSGLVNSLGISTFNGTLQQIAIADEQSQMISLLSESSLPAVSGDCDHNGVPDECQSDSDQDGTIDACEQAGGPPSGSTIPPTGDGGDEPAPVPGCGAGVFGATGFTLLPLGFAALGGRRSRPRGRRRNRCR